MKKKNRMANQPQMLTEAESNRNRLYVNYKKAKKELDAGDASARERMDESLALLMEADNALPLEKRIWKEGYRKPA